MIEKPFSTREQDVIALLMQGKTNKEIALALNITYRTVETHLGNIYEKLRVSSRTEAVIRLSEDRLRESTEELRVVNQGNPQLKKGVGRSILTKIFYYPYRPRRNLMKLLVRILVLLLVTVLLVTLIIAVFSLLRQPAPLVVPGISAVLIPYDFSEAHLS